jgi:probable rRNA maturation factor
MSELYLRNRQKRQVLNLRHLRRVCRVLLAGMSGLHRYELGVFLVEAPEMTRLNEQHLGHAGSTDVITFDYQEQSGGEELLGDIFICQDEVLANARRYRTHWSKELVRYVVHGILHLRGFDDQEPIQRRRMKREENRWLSFLEARISLSVLGSKGVLKG